MTGQVEGYKPPREDLNAPDLYIPGISTSNLFPVSHGDIVMSFVTYVLLYGIMLGAGKKNAYNFSFRHFKPIL